MQIAFIDHYDSFSFNVLDWLQRAANNDLTILRITCDDETGLARLKNKPIPTVISPGPGSPKDYPQTLKLVEKLLPVTPVLGICLGHQILGILAGGQINRAKNPWHGTAAKIKVLEKNWFTDGLPENFDAITYNSLVVALPESSWKNWERLAINDNEEIMMMSHNHLPVASVQFHPESFGSEYGETLAKNFLKEIRKWNAS